uniref:Uncharacterized protein n=1 Tax=Strongyloides venezuelensis TaxID=75913 RepID=A0A0K0G4C4_STRVS
MNLIKNIKGNIFIFLIISILCFQIIENAPRKDGSLTKTEIPSKNSKSGVASYKSGISTNTLGRLTDILSSWSIKTNVSNPWGPGRR